MSSIMLIFGPMLLAPFVYFISRGAEWVAKWAALALFVLLLIISVDLYHALPVGGGFLVLGDYLRVPGFDYALTLQVDALSVAMLILTAALLILVVFTSWEEKMQAAYFSLLILFAGPIFGVFMTTNLLWFFIFWEMTLVPMLFLVGIWGGERKVYAAIKFFLYTHFASMFMLVSFFLIYKQTGQMDFTMIKEAMLATPVLIWWFMFIGFAAKLPLFPFHTWLPDAHVEAPSSISVLLAGVLLKMGAYGLIRFVVEMMPATTMQFSMYMVVLGLTTTLFAGFLAIYERHIKKMVAYSSISHMGLVVVAIATVTYDGLSAALYEMIGHALVISPMFLIAGWVHHKTHTWYMDEMGGIMQKAPYISAIFVLAGMAALGLPGTMGFVGELTIIVSAIKAYGWWIAVAAIASLISAGYVIWAVRRAFHAEISPIVAKSKFDMSKPEFLALCIYAVLIVFFGVYPQPIFDIANNAFAMFGGM
ncbi:MAG: NADH-quinone oxidoreductase subunit M [Epsilonproteobacteria bacterium]|nr:NADH-quinone oxidoreductase subunit M [Campylobacterota bacterium]